MNQLISVIVPAYNAENHLKECLDSLIAQTYRNLEIIIVNDGSTDTTENICEKYVNEHDNIKYFYQNNQGVSVARNRGIQLAQGQYIGFVDADDIVHPNMYEHLLDILTKYKADISTVEIANDYDFKFNNIKKKESVFTQKEYLKIFFKIGSQKIIYYVWNRLYKRSIFQEIDFFDERFSIGEDVIASYKAIIRAERIVSSNQKMYFYRKGSGVTSSFNPKYFQLIEVWNQINEITMNYKLNYEEYVRINKARILFTILTEMALSGAYRNKKYKDKTIKLVNQLKNEKRLLLNSDIALSRKILISLFCINYNFSARIISKISFIERQ